MNVAVLAASNQQLPINLARPFFPSALRLTEWYISLSLHDGRLWGILSFAAARHAFPHVQRQEDRQRRDDYYHAHAREKRNQKSRIHCPLHRPLDGGDGLSPVSPADSGKHAPRTRFCVLIGRACPPIFKLHLIPELFERVPRLRETAFQTLDFSKNQGDVRRVFRTRRGANGA